MSATAHRRLKGKLQVTDRVLIIGWRAMDQHFVGLLKEHLPLHAKIQIVCGGPDHAREVETRLKDAGLPNTMQVLGYTFSSYVLERAGRDFLTPARSA